MVNVKEIRKKSGLSQTDFANMLGVTQTTISNWEQGKPIPKGKLSVLERMSNGHTIASNGIIIQGNNNHGNSVDNRHYYSDSPDVLRHEIEMLDARIKEKDQQIKEKDQQIKQLLDILQGKK